MIEEKKIVPQDKRWKEFFSLSRFRREDQFDSSRIDPSIVHGIVKAVQLARFERGEKVDGRRLIRLGNFRVVGLHFVSAAINPASWVSLSLSFSRIGVCFYLKCHFIVSTDNEFKNFPPRRATWIPLSSTFYSTRPPRQSNIRQSKCYLLLSTQHRLSTFPSLPRITFNPSSRIIIRFCSRTPPLWNLLPRSTLLLYFSFYLISLEIDESLGIPFVIFYNHSISIILW